MKTLLHNVTVETFDTGEVYVITRRSDFVSNSYRMEYFAKGKKGLRLLERAQQLHQLLVGIGISEQESA